MVKSRETVEEVLPCPSCRSKVRLEKLLLRAKIPARYFDRGFDVYLARGSLQERALRQAIEYVETFPQVQRGLLFVGPCGVGKTHLSVAILKSLIQEKMISATFVDEAELLRRLQYSYDPTSPETAREVLLPLLNIDLLVWDDLGVGRPTEWAAETIRTVINHRYTYNKHTIFSTNWPLESALKLAWKGERGAEQTLVQRIGHRLFSRIMEMCEIVEIKGPDGRIAIHKAGLDFRAAAARRNQLVVPSGLLKCPYCESRQVKQVDLFETQKSTGGPFIDAGCVCEECSQQFVARFFSETARIEYPSTL